jgi:acyl-coenzyme A synthetase/AMP-(fatty) acid ligase
MTESTPDYEVFACETLVEVIRGQEVSKTDLSSLSVVSTVGERIKRSFIC